jgi:hypothetical protein
MSQIVIAAITVYDSTLPGTRVLYYATQGFVSGAADTPANTYYDPRIQQPANMQRSCFSAGTTTGATTVGYGDMVLVNNDGGLDYLLNYSFGGRAIEIKIGTITPNQATPTWTTLIKGTMEQAAFSWGQVTIKVRDRQQDLMVPLQTTTYTGANVLPAGVEGVATDLKGKRKPLLYGQVKGVSPPCVNTSKLIYQLSATALQSVDAVYDRGVALTAGTDYGTQAAMELTAPTAGQYRTWLAGGCIRLGSTATGTLTVDATQGATAAARTAAQIMQAILLKGGISAGDISSADVTALDAACSYPLGVYMGHGQETTGAALIDEVANSIGAWWGVDRLGIFRMGRIVVPTGTAVGEISAVDILSIDRTNTSDTGAGVPAWSVSVGYARVYTPSDDLAGAVTAAEKARMKEEYRRAIVTDAATKTANTYSPELVFDTQLIAEADATAEATRRRTMYGARRDMLQLRVRLDASLAAIIDLGQIITVTLNRYGLSAGKKFLIVGIRTDMQNNIFDLTVWG